MTKSAAHVQSIEAIREFRAAVVQFERQVQEALTTLSLELRRAMDWIEHDRARYWPAEVQRAGDRLAEARSDLERCEMAIRPDERPSCMVQRKALERAKQRLRACEEKVRAVRQWRITLQQEAREFQGRLSKLLDVTETDIPRAVAALDRILQALERYAAPAALPDDPRAAEAADASATSHAPRAAASTFPEDAVPEDT